MRSSSTSGRSSRRLAAHATVLSAARRGQRATVLLATLLPILLSANWALGATGGAQDARVSAVTVHGHKSVSTREIKEIIDSALDGRFDEERLGAAVDSILRRLAERDRPFARATADWETTTDGVVLSVTLDEGEEPTLADVVLHGVSAFDAAELAATLSSRPGRALKRDALSSDIESILERYGNRGYPFASVTPTVRLGEKGEAVLTFAVDEGILTTFGEMIVWGNTLTKDQVVTREIRIDEGDPYSARKVAGIEPRLARLGLFESVEAPLVAVDPGTGLASIGIEVSEGRANSIQGALGYVPKLEQEEGYFTGRIDLALSNIAGTGRSVSVLWASVRPDYTDISFEYEEPHLLGSPINVGAKLAQSVRDTLYTTTEGDVYVTALMGDGVEVTWSLGRERYVPGPLFGTTTMSYRTALGALLDRTETPENARKGFRLNGSVTYSAKKDLDTGARDRSGTVRLVAEAFIPVRARQVAALRASLGAISSTERDVPFHEQLTLGGASSLRGYREEQFRGSRVGVGSLEYRFILGRRSWALAFLDLGYYYRGGSNFAKDTKLGYGIGLRGESRLGIISVDYGLGEGDGLLEGKLHVGLAREF